jgi:hypothetical protein
MRPSYLVGAIVLLIIGLSCAGSEQAEEEAQRALYCEMAQIYKDSGGQYGWPAYDGECE